MKNGDRSGRPGQDETLKSEKEAGGLATAGRAFGRAIGFIRRLTPKKSEDGSRPSSRPKPKAPKPRSPAKAGASARPEELVGEIARLETELDGLHAGIVGGTRAPAEGGRSAAELDQLVQRARALRASLQEKHRALARLERATARERRLASRGIAEEQASAGAPPKNGARKPAEAHAKPGRAAAPPAARDAARDLVVSKLTQELESSDAEVRRNAASRLGDLKEGSAVRPLARALEDPTDGVRVAALNALARIGAGPLEVFTRFLNDENHHLRLAALRGIAEVGSEDTIPKLVEALEDDHTMVAKTAATLLGWREARASVMPLCFALRHESAEVRAAAARALGSLRDDRGALALIRALADEDSEVREAASASLRAILGQIPLDPDADPQAQVDALREWWRSARVDARLGRLDTPAVALPAAEPSAASEAAVVSLPRPQPAKPHEVPALAKPTAHEAPTPAPKEPAAKAKLASARLAAVSPPAASAPAASAPAASAPAASARLAAVSTPAATPAAARPAAPAAKPAVPAPAAKPAAPAARATTTAEAAKGESEKTPSLDAILSGEVGDLLPGAEAEGVGIDGILGDPFEEKPAEGEASGLDSLLDQDLIGAEKKGS